VLLLASFALDARAQLTTLDKGHQLLVNSGLQIWGLNTDSFQYNFNYNNFTAANMNAVMWSFGQSNAGVLSAGQKWGKWVQPDPSQSNYTSPANSLNGTETAHYNDLVAIQVGDEQQTDLENSSGYTKAWFDAAHNGNYFNDRLLYINSTFVNSIPNFFNFIGAANPDAISWDAYPFGTTGVYPYNWLGKAQIYRRAALGSYIGASGNAPRPYGLYLQTYHGGDGARDPGDLEMRWQQFTAWTLGYTFVDTFTAGGGNTSLFNSGDGNSPSQPRYNQFKESARQSKNLGPALTRLISYGYGPNFVAGQDPNGVANAPPIDWPVFNKTNAPTPQQFLTGVSAVNLGTKNNGHPGDVYVGFFNPLLTSYGDPAGTAYFMVTNALGAYLQDPSLLVSDCTQQITLDFDFTGSNITSLKRLRRSDGQVEVVPLTHLTGNQYRLTFDLEGGTGDLFKYNDGTPFVGVEFPAISLYWDNDANGANNNLTTGTGLGGAGNWDTAASKWSNGSSNSVWTANNDAVLWGTAGTVTLSAPQSVNSLTFKTNGYTVTASTLTMTGSSVTIDSGATATIGSTVAGNLGLAKNGAGTLILTSSNSYSGGTTVNAGTLQVNSDGNLGAVPGSFTAGNITLNGGTLRFGGDFDISNNRGVTLGPNGGTINTQGFTNASGYTQADGIQGSGNLTKLGSGTFYMNTAAGQLNNSWTGNLILKEGTWKITERGGIPYNANNDQVYRPGQVSFDGGTLQIAATISVSSNYRGITIAAGGGTFDTQGFNFTWGGPVIGTATTANFNKMGSGQLQFNTATVAGTGPGTYAGILNINGGVVVFNGGGAWGDTSTVNLANAAGVGLTISGATETIGSIAGGGAAGGNVTLGATLIIGGNNATTTFSGLVGGTGGLTKNGSGTFTLDRSAGNTYNGATTINAGKLLVNNTSGSGTGTNNVTVNNGAALGGTGKISGAVTVNNGGHVEPGASIESLDVGTLTLAAGSVLDFELDTVVGADTSDLLNVTTNNGLTINGGTLNLTNAANMTGGIFTLIDYAGVLNGNLINITMGSTPAGFSYRLLNDVSTTSILLEVTAPGDYNHDGVVDAGDYVTLRKGFGTKYLQADMDAWRVNFGQTYPNGSGASLAAVPEPAAWVLLSLGAAWMFAYQRNSSRVLY
jgi:autotransporter-associated beta strand protein